MRMPAEIALVWKTPFADLHPVHGWNHHDTGTTRLARLDRTVDSPGGEPLMDWVFNGLPLHVLLVHFVVIVVPVAALCTVLAAAWPAARRRLGFVTPLVAGAALVAVPITVEAGEWLLRRVAATPLIGTHVDLGRTLLPWVIALFAVALVQWAWFAFVAAPQARFAQAVPGRRARLGIAIVLAVAVGVTAIGSVTAVVRIGESGSRAIWTNSFTP